MIIDETRITLNNLHKSCMTTCALFSQSIITCRHLWTTFVQLVLHWNTTKRARSMSTTTSPTWHSMMYTSLHAIGIVPTLTGYLIIKQIGVGTFGTVFLCRSMGVDGQLYALKVLEKETIRKTHQVERTLTERRVLTLTHPFVTTLYRSFATKDHLVLVMEYCPGGDLYTVLDKHLRLSLPVVTFYAASLILALQHLHTSGVVYRDLKPENIIVDGKGYIRLADFGLAKDDFRKGQVTRSICGSVEYMAPEVITGQDYGHAVDLWSLGCVLYELLTGFSPFYSGSDKRKAYDKIKRGVVTFPPYMDSTTSSFLVGLLQLDPTHRIGCSSRGYLEILEHPFFQSINWYNLGTQTMEPPPLSTVPCPEQPVRILQGQENENASGFLQPPSSALPPDEFASFDWISKAV